MGKKKKEETPQLSGAKLGWNKYLSGWHLLDVTNAKEREGFKAAVAADELGLKPKLHPKPCVLCEVRWAQTDDQYCAPCEADFTKGLQRIGKPGAW